MQAHWAEIDGDGEFDPDWQRLFAAARAGRMQVFTARRGGIIGYILFQVSPELLCKRRLVAEARAFWLTPAERFGWIGYHLIKNCEPALASIGVREICFQPTIDFCNDRGQTVGVIFRRLGYRPTEVRQSKPLGAGHVGRVGK